jgi:hypothetical protein
MKSLRKNVAKRTEKLTKIEGRSSETEKASRSFSKSAEEYNDKHLTPEELKVAKAERAARATSRASKQEERDREFARRKEERAARVAKIKGYRQDRNDGSSNLRDGSSESSKSKTLSEPLIPDEEGETGCCGCVVS